MPIVRKLMNVGVDSRAITLPKSWIENAEQTKGKKIIAIALEVGGKSQTAIGFLKKYSEGAASAKM